MRVRLSASVLLATVLGLVVLVAPSAQAASTPTAFSDRLVSLINQARQQHGLRALTVASGTSTVAAGWTQHLASQRALSHNPNLGSELSSHGSANWTTYAENVGQGPTSPADTLFQSYMSSPEHRANILSAQFRYIGVGVAFSGGYAWNTLDFVDQYSSSTSSTTRTTTTSKPKTKAVAVKPVIVTTTKVAPAPAAHARTSVQHSAVTRSVGRHHVHRHPAVVKPTPANPHAMSSPRAATPQRHLALVAAGDSTASLSTAPERKALPSMVAFILLLLLASRLAKALRSGTGLAAV